MPICSKCKYFVDTVILPTHGIINGERITYGCFGRCSLTGMLYSAAHVCNDSSFIKHLHVRSEL